MLPMLQTPLPADVRVWEPATATHEDWAPPPVSWSGTSMTELRSHREEVAGAFDEPFESTNVIAKNVNAQLSGETSDVHSPDDNGVLALQESDHFTIRARLLARTYVLESLTPEEAARLAIIEDRIDARHPRYTTHDFAVIDQIDAELERREAEVRGLLRSSQSDE